MSPLIELARGWAATAVAAGGSTLVFGMAGALAGALIALAVALLVGRAARWVRGRRVRIASLAARGASRAEIARRTGLSQDAVGLLLSVRESHRGRRNLPVPARIAAFRRADAPRRNRDWNPQAFAGGQLRSGATARRGSARALPSGGASSNGLTRSGQAA